MEQIRINKYLSQTGVCSRRQADRLIEDGRVRVNGLTAQTGQKVSSEDRVTVDDKPVTGSGKEIFLAVNKPRGVVVTTDRSHGDTVLEDLVDCGERVFAVGRLDKDSEGLILMTNNGDVSNLIQKAREKHEKEYIVTVDAPVTEKFLGDMASGVYLEDLDRTTRPCRVRKTGVCSFDIILTEGMNRQIRRMCMALGYEVTALKRVRIMNIFLGGLRPGRWRELSRDEVSELKRLTGYRMHEQI